MKTIVRTVLVTGGSSGIGAAATRLLCSAGMTVYAASRSGKAPEGCSFPMNMIPLALDVNDESALSSAVERIVSEQGTLDAVVCSAGNGIAGPVEDTSSDEVRAQFETTFFGVVKTIQTCAPIFRKQGHGRVVTISSVAAVAPLPFQPFYSCAKAGILQLTKALAVEMRPYGVQCCCIMPGDVRTGFTKARRVAKKAESEDSAYHDRTIEALKQMEIDEQKNGMKPEVIGAAVVRQLERRKMSPECVPTFIYSLFVVLIRILPERLVLKVIGKMYS